MDQMHHYADAGGNGSDGRFGDVDFLWHGARWVSFHAFWLQAQVLLAQAFSLGAFLPDLAKDGAAYMVVTVCAWVTISVGIGLTVMGLMNEASLSAAFVF